jgi:SAM-dependent methyltransferase
MSRRTGHTSESIPSAGTPYTHEWFEAISGGSRLSAEAVVPIVLELVHAGSVVDVGCGTGTWLSVFQARGVEDVIGIDGDYVDRARLQISAERFLARDLSRPFELRRTFDLAVSVEVAEHLPREAAEPFVATLVKLAPVALFSAAIPGQGGTHHINEQWPVYWAELFERHGFVVADVLRPLIWQNPDVEPWYCQNAMLFVRRDVLREYPSIRRAMEAPRPLGLNVVHPRQFDYTQMLLRDHFVSRWSSRELLRALAGQIGRRFVQRVRRLRSGQG